MQGIRGWGVYLAGSRPTLNLVNGVLDPTVGTSAGYAATADSRMQLRIGNAHTVDVPFTGRMDDLRIVKGGALYSTNFTPVGPK